MPEEEKIGAIMRHLPDLTRGKIQTDHPGLLSDLVKLRKWPADRAKQLTRNAYVPGKPKAMHLLDEDGPTDPETEEEVNALSQATGMAPEVVMAFRRFFKKGVGAGTKPIATAPRGAPPAGQGERREAPPRDGRDARCGNCGDKEHTSRECPKPRV